MKILELTNYSAGVCGVWNRVREESVRLSKLGHEVRVFSSNFVKGNDEIAPFEDSVGKVKIRRFRAKKLGGESFMKWNFEAEALKYKPDVIIAHSYRHRHTTKALKIKEKIGCKVILVTHAPFGRDNRNLTGKIAVWFYDTFVGRRTINRFDKVITITKWEYPFLMKLGLRKEKIVYIPNGIPEEFFSNKEGKEDNKILFLGRISPIKNIEILIKAIPLIKDNEIKVEIVGPPEKDYLNYLKSLVNKLKLNGRVIFSKPIYELNEKIGKIDSCRIFVLPSKTEGMPQSLIEAMARGRIVIASDNLGAKDLVSNGENGYLFTVGNERLLAENINLVLNKDNKKMKIIAKKSVEQFSWDKIIRKIELIIE